ncbi:MAG: ATP-dependent Clp protease ATP-binding subunit [Candidatus Moranbacteria bacterium]|nr:ATP-dependent Clp protease ATP-binding subunit [Candidatus Moranbacteria bacterium]
MLETNFSQKLTLHARHSLKEARDIARAACHTSIEPEHVLIAIFFESTSLGGILLQNIGFEREILVKLCLKKKTKGKSLPVNHPLPLSSALKDILRRAYFLANQFHYPYVGTEHILYALFESENETLERILSALKINDTKVRATLESHLNFDHFPQLSKMLDLPENLLTKNRTTKSNATPFLDQYAVDMARSPSYAEETLVGREKELDRIIQILTRKRKNNPLLLGDPGVGKTALIVALAKMIQRGAVPHTLLGKRILSLDLTLVVAGTNFRGEFESRLKEIIREATQNHDTILFIDEIHTVVGAGNTSGGLDAANILKPALSRGEIQCIGATTFTEYKRHLEKDPALDRRFQSVLIVEPTIDETKEILWHIKKSYEDFHHIALSKEVSDMAVELSVRYLPERFLPDKALDIIDEASTLAKQKREIPETTKILIELGEERRTVRDLKESLIKDENYDDAAKWHAREKALSQKITTLKEGLKENSENERITVSGEHILKTVSQMARIPFAKLSKENPRQRLTRLHKALDTQLIGQKEAALALEKTLTRSLSSIGDPNRPLGSFLFLGPTGVGKTLAAKILAEEFFGDQNALIRLDMSEFMERHSVAQILGAPAGYVGYGEGGKLTEAVRRKPYSVILFDEIEKAHPDVWSILLQILDEGILTDAEGRRVSFKNALIILTSNIGTASFTKTARIGFATTVSGGTAKTAAKNSWIKERFEIIKREVLDELKKEMRPELLARLDHTIVFNALSEEAIHAITRLELGVLAKRLKPQNIILKYPDALVRFIAKKSFAPEQGARLVRKNIQDFVEKSIAEELIDAPEKKSLRLSLKNDMVVCHPMSS